MQDKRLQSPVVTIEMYGIALVLQVLPRTKQRELGRSTSWISCLAGENVWKKFDSTVDTAI